MINSQFVGRSSIPNKNHKPTKKKTFVWYTKEDGSAQVELALYGYASAIRIYAKALSRSMDKITEDIIIACIIWKRLILLF